MHEAVSQLAPQESHPAAPRLISDRQLAPVIGVSVAFLQKDRREGRRIPFYRIGDRCLYDLQEVLAAIRAYAVGGPVPSRRIHRR